MPDIFVPQDTTGMTSYFRMAASRGLIIRYSFDYTDNNRNTLQKYDTVEKMLGLPQETKPAGEIRFLG